MFESQVNGYLARALADSPRARELCAALEGRRIELHVTGFPGPLCLAAADGALQYSAAAGAPADVTVAGGPLALLALARGDTDAALAQGTIAVTGDEDLMRQFQALARLLRPDPEALAGGVIGRIPAHLAARALGALNDWGRAAGESFARNAADYLAHESRDLVPRAEAENHIAGIEALRAQAAAAEARLARLAERLDALAPTGADAADHSTRRGQS
ncbi:MAG: SCP2 sterol-binding domain-containing protein [Proteobacteria bacterium]|nr:SCP2 sterol-binding domain-containing protein [Pseudomonadota bacterium]